MTCILADHKMIIKTFLRYKLHEHTDKYYANYMCVYHNILYIRPTPVVNIIIGFNLDNIVSITLAIQE